MLINSLPHKTSSYSHHFDSTFCSCHKFIPDDIQIYVSLKKKKKKGAVCSFHCTPGYNIQIKLTQFLPVFNYGLLKLPMGYIIYFLPLGTVTNPKRHTLNVSHVKPNVDLKPNPTCST